MEQLRNNRKELIGLRTIVKQLQNSQDEDATHFLDADHRHQVLKTDLMILRKELSSSLTKEHLDKLYHSLATNQSKILSSVKEEQNRFTRTIDGRVGEDLKKLSSWFTEHDLLATKRQANLDKKFSSYARANELAELKENLESDGEILTSKVVKATKMLKKALFDIGNSDQKKTMQNLNRRVLGFFKQLLLMGFKTWYKFSEKTVEYQKRQQLQYSCMMKMAAKQNCGLVRFGMAMWKKHCSCMRQLEADQKRAILVLKRTITKMIMGPQEAGFKHWHRFTMLANENLLRQGQLTEIDEKGVERATDLSSIMGTFHGDLQGGIDVLTRELIRIRNEDLANLKRDWLEEKLRSKEENSEVLNKTLDDIKNRAEQFENQISSKLTLLALEVPKMKSMMMAEGRKVGGLEKNCSKLDLKVGKNKGNIDSLLMNSGRIETRIFELETEVVTTKRKLGVQEGQLNSALGLIERLEHRLDDAGEREDELKNLMLAKDKTIENEMKELRALILGEGERVGRVQDEILREKEYARDMEENVNGDLDEIRKVVFSHGAPKPDLKLMVSACLPFESLSFSKKWCPPINSGELNNIPDAIAGFSVDMASWIAFRADFEALSRVVVGQNPEEMVYADEEIEYRRKSLMSEVREEWEKLMEEESEKPGALRLEARTKFVARLMDGIDSALSKHDQVLITGSSRASRIKASVPVCVACDRPLRTKARKGKLMEEGGGGGGEGEITGNLGQQAAFKNTERRPTSANNTDRDRNMDASSGGYVGGRSGGIEDGGLMQGELDGSLNNNNFVMRSGFKFPQKRVGGLRSSSSSSMLETIVPNFQISHHMDLNSRTGGGGGETGGGLLTPIVNRHNNDENNSEGGNRGGGGCSTPPKRQA